MKISRLLAPLLLAPALAQAHPGHSFFDFTAGPIHPGHEHEIARVLFYLGILCALLGIRWLTSRR